MLNRILYGSCLLKIHSRLKQQKEKELTIRFKKSILKPSNALYFQKRRNMPQRQNNSPYRFKIALKSKNPRNISLSFLFFPLALFFD